MVRRRPAGCMGSPLKLFRLSLEVRGPGSLDRMGLPPSVGSSEAGGQQQPFSDPAGLACAESGFSHSVVVRKEAPP